MIVEWIFVAIIIFTIGIGWKNFEIREITEDGKELLFDHGAPYFTVTNPDVLSVVAAWESSGLVAEWKINLGSFDCFSNKFVNVEHQVLTTIIIIDTRAHNSVA